MTLRRVVRSPLTRVIIATCAVGGAVFGAQTLVARAWLLLSPGDRWPFLAHAIVLVIAVLAAYAGYVRLIERRPLAELAPARCAPEFGAGVLLGAGLFAATIGAIGLAGSYQVTGVDGLGPAAAWLPLAAGSAFAEEVLARGVIFRIAEEGLGTWMALAISSLLFGLAHLANPHATVLSALFIGLEAGVLLAAAFVLTRRLWLPIGVHFAWNFVQGGVFGVAVSGFQLGGILKSRLSGPALLSGGPFGAEASIFAVGFGVLAGVGLLAAAKRRGRFVPPPWARARDPVAAAPAPGGAAPA